MTRVLWFNEQQGFSTIEVNLPAGEIIEQLHAGKQVISGLDLLPPYLIYYRDGLIVITRGHGQPSCHAGVRYQKPHVTPKEKTVLQALGNGLTIKEISAQMGIKQRTVIFYIATLKNKFNAQTTEQLIGQAVAMGLCVIQPISQVPSDATI
ncbi:MAG TPA: helix-turn-helix transcriptional regulator [Anaerolineaceae bacterium]|nr:helix-turn-helix transcriptional regulator [Anaerolineaceae bacterium]